MPLVDSNVWVALSLSKHEFHAAARAWLAQRAPREAHSAAPSSSRFCDS